VGADGNYNVTIPLTTTAVPSVSSGAIYLLLQSEDPATHHDLISLIGSNEGNIQPNVSNWNYGYSQFEFTLSGSAADQGNLTAIPGYGQHIAGISNDMLVGISMVAG